MRLACMQPSSQEEKRNALLAAAAAAALYCSASGGVGSRGARVLFSFSMSRRACKRFFFKKKERHTPASTARGKKGKRSAPTTKDSGGPTSAMHSTTTSLPALLPCPTRPHAAGDLQSLLWHHAPVVDALVSRLRLADLVVLGSATRTLYLALLRGPRYLAKRLADERALCFRTAATLKPWARADNDGDCTVTLSRSGDVVLRIAPPLGVLARQPARWTRMRRRLAEAWARVRLGGWPLHPTVFAEAVLAASAGGDARLIIWCMGVLTEHMCRGGGHACAVESVEALASRMWAERDDDLVRALPVTVHVTAVLLMRAHGLGVVTLPERTTTQRRAPPSAYDAALCHVEPGWPAIETEAARRLFGGFVHDAILERQTTCEIARRVVGLFSRRVCKDDPNARGNTHGVVALAADCAAALAATGDADWAWRFTLEQALDRLSGPLAHRRAPFSFPSA